MRGVRWTAIVALWAAALGSGVGAAGAQDQGRQKGPTVAQRSAASVGESSQVAQINNWTVGVAGGLMEGTFLRFVAEMAKVMDDGENLRVLPIVTYGAAENVRDLLYLKGIDIALTHADVFDAFKKEGKVNNIDRRINYIAQFYVGELHVYARPEIKRIEDLAGKKVGFNTKGAGPTVTGPILFERLGIKVEPQFVNNAIALEKMRTGEIAAILHTVAKPNDLFLKYKPEPGFHFLNVAYTDKFADYYLPSTIAHEDYPNLMQPGEKVETLGIPVVLAVYNWPAESDRYRRVARFIEYYFMRFERFKQPPFHTKWKEMNLAAKVPGWTRYRVAEEMLARLVPQQAPLPTPAPAPAAATSAGDPAVAQAFERFLQAQAGGRALSEQEREALFRAFQAWTQQQAKARQ
jgi:TRAP-type uncharacterized transport system substrate-binding protein